MYVCRPRFCLTGSTEFFFFFENKLNCVFNFYMFIPRLDLDLHQDMTENIRKNELFLRQKIYLCRHSSNRRWKDWKLGKIFFYSGPSHSSIRRHQNPIRSRFHHFFQKLIHISSSKPGFWSEITKFHNNFWKLRFIELIISSFNGWEMGG